MSELNIMEIVYKQTPEGYTAEEKQLGAHDGLVMPESVGEDEYLKRIREANSNFQRLADGEGRRHELTVMNAEKMENGIIFRPSTSFSSITKNPAWMLEGAYLAASYPNVAHVNWSAFNNYGTRALKMRDILYNTRTGRLTKGNGSDSDPYRAVDSIKRLVNMLDEHDLMPTHFVADQEAGRLVLPMMVEMANDSVRGVALNGIDGIAKSASYVAAPLMEDAASRIRRRHIGDGEVGEVTPMRVAELKANMPSVYHGWQKNIHIAPFTLALLRDDALKIAQVVATRGKNNLEDLERHAVYQDMRAALQNQDARIDLQFNAKSSRHEDLSECIRFGKLIMDGLVELEADSGEQRGVRLLLNEEGTWSGNTDQPRETAAIRRLGLPGITRLAVLTGGLPVLRQIGNALSGRHSA
jgi:hypothetical protein